MKQVLGGNKIEGHVVLTNTGIIVSILYILLTPLIFFIGRELVKSKYRSRAFRIYFNYLTK